MGADEDLAPSLPPELGHHRRDVAHHLGMKRELRLLEQQRSGAVEQHPEQPEQPQGAVRQLILGLPSGFRTPVLVKAKQVGDSAFVPLELKLLQLGDGHPQRVLNTPKPGVEDLLWCACDLVEKVSAKRIVDLADGSGGLADELRHDVQVLNPREEVLQTPEVLVRRWLLQVGLGYPD